MKRFLLGISFLATLSFAGCSSDEEPMTVADGYGYLNLSCMASTEVATRAGSDIVFTVPEAADFALTITGADYEQTWNPFSTFVSADNRLKAGDYTASVAWGDTTSEGVDKAAYAGSVPFTIVSQQVTSKQIAATLTKGLVTVHFTEQFCSYFHDELVTLTTAAGNDFDFDSTTTDAVFVLPGRVTLSGKALKQTGEEFTFAVDAQTIEANTLHPFTFDLKTAGTATVTISYQDVVVEEITIDTELNPES